MKLIRLAAALAGLALFAASAAPVMAEGDCSSNGERPNPTVGS